MTNGFDLGHDLESIFEFCRSYMILAIWWLRSGVRIYQIMTGVTSDVGVPSTHLVISAMFKYNFMLHNLSSYSKILLIWISFDITRSLKWRILYSLHQNKIWNVYMGCLGCHNCSIFGIINHAIYYFMVLWAAVLTAVFFNVFKLQIVLATVVLALIMYELKHF